MPFTMTFMTARTVFNQLDMGGNCAAGGPSESALALTLAGFDSFSSGDRTNSTGTLISGVPLAISSKQNKPRA